MPNGKPLGECTGAEMKAIRQAYETVAALIAENEARLLEATKRKQQEKAVR